MIETTFFDRWIIEYDADATRDVYARIQQGGADECVCLYCKNYALAREQVFKSPVKALFESLGVDYRKEAEVWTYGSSSNNYEGFYHFVGSVSYAGCEEPTAKLSCGQETLLDFVNITPKFAVCFRDDAQLVEEEFEGKTVASIEIRAEVPWLLGEIKD